MWGGVMPDAAGERTPNVAARWRMVLSAKEPASRFAKHSSSNRTRGECVAKKFISPRGGFALLLRVSRAAGNEHILLSTKHAEALHSRSDPSLRKNIQRILQADDRPSQ